MGPADSPAGCSAIRVDVVFSPAPREVQSTALTLPLGSTVKDALQEAGLLERSQGLGLGLWGRKTTLCQVLSDRDRVEVYRGLIVDPKEARRVRYRAHGAKPRKGVQRPKPTPDVDPAD